MFAILKKKERVDYDIIRLFSHRGEGVACSLSKRYHYATTHSQKRLGRSEELLKFIEKRGYLCLFIVEDCIQLSCYMYAINTALNETVLLYNGEEADLYLGNDIVFDWTESWEEMI